jgi:hypothetical protein
MKNQMKNQKKRAKKMIIKVEYDIEPDEIRQIVAMIDQLVAKHNPNNAQRKIAILQEQVDRLLDIINKNAPDLSESTP